MSINLCPESIDFEFKFEGQCPISSCQHCTKATKNGCLFLDRKESSDKPITNKEISYYKRGHFPEFKDYDQKALDSLVRQSQARARAAICMQHYINWLSDNELDRNLEYVPQYALVHETQNYLSQTFDSYEPWMIFHMNDEEKFDQVVRSLASTDITLGQALGRMTPKKYQSFCQALVVLRNK